MFFSTTARVSCSSWVGLNSVEFVVLGEPTPEHAAALASVPGGQLFTEVASI